MINGFYWDLSIGDDRQVKYTSGDWKITREGDNTVLWHKGKTYALFRRNQLNRSKLFAENKIVGGMSQVFCPHCVGSQKFKILSVDNSNLCNVTIEYLCKTCKTIFAFNLRNASSGVLQGSVKESRSGVPSSQLILYAHIIDIGSADNCPQCGEYDLAFAEVGKLEHLIFASFECKHCGTKSDQGSIDHVTKMIADRSGKI